MHALAKTPQGPGTVLTALLVVLTALAPLLYVPALLNPDLPRYPLLAAVAGFGLVCLALDIWHGRTRLRWPPTLTLIGAFFVWAMLSALWAQDPWNNAIETNQLTALVLISLLATQVANEKNTLLLLAVATASASIAALLGLWQNAGVDPFELRDAFVMGSTFCAKNFAALYFDFIIPAAFVLVLIAKTRSGQWLAATALALCGAYILASRARGSWLGLTVAAITFAIIAGRMYPSAWLWGQVRARCLPLLAAATVMVTLFLLPGEINQYWDKSVAPGHIVDSSTEARLRYYVNSLPMIKDHLLLGTGLGSFRQAYRPYMHSRVFNPDTDEDMYIDQLHNEPLQYLVELGLFGGLLAWGTYLAVLRVGVRTIRVAKESTPGLLAIALLLGLVTNGVHALVDFPYHTPAAAIQFWISVGLLVGLAARLKRAHEVHLRPIHLGALLLLAVAFLAHNTLFYSRYLYDNYHSRIAYQLFSRPAMDAKECREATDHIEQAEQVFGYYWLTHALRTRIHGLCERDPVRLLDTLNDELAYEPTNARALLTRAEIYRRYEMADLARQDYTQVLQLFPKSGSAYFGLARLAVADNRLDDALSLLNTAIAHAPLLLEAQTLRSEILKKSPR